MYMNVTCPTCAHRCRVPESALGQSVQCPGCASYFRCGSVSPPSLVAQPLGPASPGAVQTTPQVRAASAPADATVHYRCVRCAHPLESPARMAGGKINCPSCGQRLQIPQPASALPPVPVHTVAPAPPAPEPPVLRPAAPAPAPAAAPAVRVENCLECGIDVSQRPRVQTCPDCGSLFCSARCYREHHYHAHPRSRRSP